MSQKFSVGSVIARSFSIWLRNMIPFTVLGAIVYAPIIIYTVITLSGDLTLENITHWGYAAPYGGSFLNLIIAGALMYGTFQQHRGRPASVIVEQDLDRLSKLLPPRVITSHSVRIGSIDTIQSSGNIDQPGTNGQEILIQNLTRSLQRSHFRSSPTVRRPAHSGVGCFEFPFGRESFPLGASLSWQD